jgi:hypothetical protein
MRILRRDHGAQALERLVAPLCIRRMYITIHLVGDVPTAWCRFKYHADGEHKVVTGYGEG